MKKLVALGLLAAALAGCSTESPADKALDTASPTANMAPPPAPTGKGRAPAPPSMGGPGGPSAAPSGR